MISTLLILFVVGYDTMAFDWNAISSPEIIGGSQLPDVPHHGLQQTQVPAGEAQGAEHAQTKVGSSQAAAQALAEAGLSQMATPSGSYGR
jgi:hypothetical protein